MSEPTIDPTTAFSNALNNANAAPADTGPQNQNPTGTSEPASGQQSSGGHPSWNAILSAVPPSLHDKVRPTLEQWDQGVQQKLEQVHSRYDPYKSFVDQNVSPDILNAGYQLYQILNNDPRRLYNELANFLGIEAPNSGQGQNQQQNQPQDPWATEQQPQFNIEQDPRFRQLADQQAQMQQFLAYQENQRQEQAANVWLDTRLGQLRAEFSSKYGADPDPSYLMGVATGKINAGMDPDRALTEAYQMYEKMYNSVRNTPSANSSAPPVLAPSGAVPQSGFNPAKMSDTDRKKLMGEMLTQAFKE